MAALVPYLLTAAVLALLMGCFGGRAVLVRRRGLAGAAVRAAVAAYEEAYHPSGRDTHVEILAQAERRAPVALPGAPRGDAGTGAEPFRPQPGRPRRRPGRLAALLRRTRPGRPPSGR
ncbi:hypothetical protein [Kitasatospora arboriphila]|uniref:Uncharacterized protein n=1 Tax=Kitasatospora arboriphila TaxID=258052 RepID=A0ABN1TCM9_9ACTN